MRFTVIPQNTFEGMQTEAGVLLSKFDPATAKAPEDKDIICATTGGITISCTPTYSDMGEDVDNCPTNMKELKRLTGWECKMSFTSLGTSPESIRMALGAADVDEETGMITPRRDLKQSDFADIWWVGDRADGGMVAACLKNALSTSGFSLKTSKSGKGQVSVELTGHVSIDDQTTMPMVLYSTEPTMYELTAASDIENGTIAFKVNGAAATKAVEGDIVTVTATPTEGYQLKSVTASDAGGSAVTVTGTMFKMPGSAVTVTAEFETVGGGS